MTNLIMLIEDDDDHAELIRRTLEEHPIPNTVIHFQDGQSALDYLFRGNNLGDPDMSFRPQVILLDLHLTDIDGIDILKRIKASDQLRTIPVVMLTTSAAETDIQRAYCNHVNSYVVKPIEWERFQELMDILCSYWLGKNMRLQIQDATY